MTILVGSDVPGLLSALEQTLGSAQQLAVARDAETISALISNPSVRLDALIAGDTITPHPGKDIATSLWEITAYMSRYREPTAPVILTVAHDMPAVIQEALRTEAEKTGGDLQTISRRARAHDHPEAQQAVAWIMERLSLEPQRRQYTIVATGTVGGSGTTSTVMNICLQLNRLGLRVLAVDLDVTRSGLRSWLRLQEPVEEGFGTLPDEFPNLIETYPLELIERRIVHHRTGLDLLFAGPERIGSTGLDDALLEGLINTIALLDYDIVCYDLPVEWKLCPALTALPPRVATWPIVVCPPGRKERDGAFAALDMLGTIERDDGRTALDTAMVLFIEGESGQVQPIRSVRQELLRQYPAVTDLGTLPRDPALLSMAAERHEFSPVFDLAPRRPYCHAIRAATRRWIEAVALPPAWLTRIDPYERRPRGTVQGRHTLRGRRPKIEPLPGTGTQA
jgi:MinD-like ATPase involved in chromosome partitioning or flagellar assembly